MVAGVDEAGRGPLAGPVVASAVILPRGRIIEHCNDSKLLTSKTRRELCNSILNDSEILVGIGVISSVEIDEINILRATIRAMTLAIQDLLADEFLHQRRPSPGPRPPPTPLNSIGSSSTPKSG